MPHVEFEPDGLAVDVPVGTPLMKAAEENDTFLEFGCRNGMCGTCVITILAGEKYLKPPTPEEQATLEELGAKPGQRLGCQLKITHDLKISR